MSSSIRRSRPILYAASLFLAGCGGTGTETISGPPVPAPSQTNTISSVRGSDVTLPIRVEKAPELESATDTTPSLTPASKDTIAKTTSPEGAAIQLPSDELSRVILASAINSRTLLTLANQAPAGKNVPEDLAKPADFLWQAPRQTPKDEPLAIEPPLGLQPLTPGAVVPNSNPITKAKAELGRQLFFDPRLSRDGTVSCATCHNPEKGWTDLAPVSTGINGQKGGRSAPTVLNTAYGKTFFWDGRAPSLEGQCQGPPINPIEMGYESYVDMIRQLRQIPRYQEQFLSAFGTDVTLDGVAKAIATFERVFALSGDSPYDRYLAGDNKAISDSAKRGMYLFGLRLAVDDDFDVSNVTLKKANCTSCHVGFNFTDELFHNLGVGWDETKKEFKDVGRWAIAPIGAKADADLGAFKTPTIRDIERTAPYMHDGSEKDLMAVVEYYDKGGIPNPALDKDMKKLNLTPQEKEDLVVFMKTLTGQVIKVALPTLPPDSNGNAPDPAKALVPPSPEKTASAAASLHGATAR